MAENVKFKYGTTIEGKTPEAGDFVAINKGMSAGDDDANNKFGSLYRGKKILGTTEADKLVTTAKITVAGLSDNLGAGIANGDEIPAGTSLQEFLTMLLSKELNPGAATKPSISISGNSGMGLKEVYSTVTVPAVSMSTNNGKFNNNGWTEPAQPAVAGVTWSAKTITPSAQSGFTGYAPEAGESIAQATSVKIALGSNSVTYTATGTYTAPTNKPITNLGKEYSGAEATWVAGSASKAETTTAATGVYPVFTNNEATLTAQANTKLALTEGPDFEVSFNSELAAGQFIMVAIPDGFTVSKVEVYNTMGNKYETYNGQSKFEAEPSQRDINGTQVQYQLWTRQGDNKNNAIKYKFTLSKKLSA
jgi:hypothetical protein